MPTPVNRSPVAYRDNITGPALNSFVITKASLLGNDSDADNNVLSIASVTGLIGGTVSLTASGDILFTRIEGFVGEARFTYRASDGQATSNAATVYLQLPPVPPAGNRAPLANADTLSAFTNTAVTYSAAQLLANDSDPDGNPLSIASVTSGTGGSAVLNPNGSVTFTPNAGFSGSASFSYRATDGQSTNALSNAASVSINVQSAANNRAPVAVRDNFNGSEDTPITFAAAQLLANDSDPDGNTLSIASVSAGANGSAVLNANGSVTFTPNANYNGVASFTYRATDGIATSASASVLITLASVNDAPVANADTLSALINTPITYSAAQLLANDTDVDSATLSIVSATSGANGSAVRNANGSVTFTPNADFTGTASFTYIATDGNSTNDKSNAATVSVTVQAANRAPIVNNDSLNATEDTPITFLASQLLANDSDPDGNPLRIASLFSTGGASVSLTKEGNVLFTPEANFNGVASFGYRASDGLTTSSVASVNVSVAAVNDAPIGKADAFGQFKNNEVVTFTTSQLLGNDIDVDGDRLSITSVSGAKGGSAVFDAKAGTVTFTVSDTYLGQGYFFYRATDGLASTSNTLVSFTVIPDNEPPVANNDSLTAVEDTPITYTAAQLLDNDSDPDMQPGTLSIASVTSGPGGTAVLNGDGDVVFTPNANFNGSASFTYQISDGEALSNVATVSVSVAAVNDAPSFDLAATGKVLTGFGLNSTDRGNSVTVDAEGRILVAGLSDAAGNNDFALARYTAAGVLDTSFGTGGLVTTAFGTNSADEGASVSVDALGRILVAGVSNAAGNNDFALARYTASGVLDTSFGGGDGLVTTDFGASSTDAGNSVTVDADGRILVAGGSGAAFALARYTASGVLDTSFGGGDGLVTTAFGGGSFFDQGLGVSVDAMGRIVVAGRSGGDFALARYTASGVLDTSFGGGDGLVTTGFGTNSSDVGNSLSVDADGSILVAGFSDATGGGDFALARYTASGELDLSFGGGDGLVTTGFGGSLFDAGNSVTVDADGRILVAGASGGGDFALARYTASGVLDTSFGGGDGLVTTDFGASSFDQGLSVSLDADGGIVVAGFSSATGLIDFALARYNEDGSLDTRFGPVSSVSGRVAFTEGMAPVVLSTTAVVLDADLAALNGGAGNYSGASLTLARSGGANAQDVFSGSGAVSFAGGNLTVSGTTIGSLTQTGGTLTLSFNTSATQTLVNQALQGTAYSNASDAPPASVNISWTFSDGNTAAQGPGGALTAMGSTTVNITPVNDAPVAVNDNLTAVEDTPIIYTKAQLLGNDTDVDNLNSALTIASVTSGFGGSAVLNGNGDVEFTPDANFNGSASFTYQASDGEALSNVATVSVSVAAVNDAPVAVNDNLTAVEDTPIIYTKAQLLGNDTDVEMNTLSIASVTSGPGGTAVLNGGNVEFTPDANFNGVASFTYVASDGQALNNLSNVATVSVTVAAVNDAPVAVNDNLTAVEDTPITYTKAQLLGNDTDVEMNTLSIASVTSGPGGSAVLNGNGDVEFTPDANFNGVASFTYVASDGQAENNLSNTATASVTVASVNDAPAGTNAAVFVNEDTSYTFTAADFGFTDPNDSPPNTLDAVIITTLPGAGSLMLAGEGVLAGNAVSAAQIGAGQLSFKAALNENGEPYSSFTFQVRDNGGTANGGQNTDQSPNTLTITVFSVNDAPVAVNDNLMAVEDTPIIYTKAQLLGNDTDVEMNTLSIATVTSGSGGTVMLNGSGDVVFTPNANFNGSASFTYVASDGQALNNLSNTATVDVMVAAVNDAPEGTDAMLEAEEDTPYTFFASDFGFSDPNDSPGNALDAVIFTNLPEGGNLQLNGIGLLEGDAVLAAQIGAGDLRYVPPPNATGEFDSFTFQVRDDGGTANGGQNTDQSPNTISFSVAAVNDAPVFIGLDDGGDPPVPDMVMFTEDGPAVVLDMDVVIDDVELVEFDDYSGSSISLQRVGETFASDVFDLAAGKASISMGSLMYNDGMTISNVGTVSNMNGVFSISFANGIGFEAVNDVLQHITYSNTSDTPPSSVNIRWTFNDGNAAMDGAQGSGGPRSTTGTTTVNIMAVNDAPVANDDTATTPEDTPIVFQKSDLLVNDADPDTALGALSITAVGGAVGGSVVLGMGGGAVTFTPDANFNGSASFTYTLSDGALTDTATVNITVSAVPDPAVIGGEQTGAVTEDGPLTDTGMLTVMDVDGMAEETFQVVEGGVTTYGSYDLTEAGLWTYTLDNANPDVQALPDGVELNDSFVVESFDGTEATVNITITGTNDDAMITGETTGSIMDIGELGGETASGMLTVTDVDTGENVFNSASLTQTGTYGNFSITAEGAWTYNYIGGVADNTTETENFTVTSFDGTDMETVMIEIMGQVT